MFITGSSATLTIVAFMISILVVLGGFILRKLAKPEERVKRNISLGLILFGGITTLLNAPQIWQIINGTFVEPESNALSDLGDALSDALGNEQNATAIDTLPSTIEMFGSSIDIITLASLASVGIGVLTIIIGLVLLKKKEWAKVVILGGVITMLVGLSQLLF